MGRDREMLDLHDRLQQADRVAIAAVGMGGIGKTTLARRYAHSYRADYPGGIWWVSAKAAESNPIATDVLGYAGRSIGLEELDPRMDEAAIVRHYLARWAAAFPGQKLLVLDDVGEFGAVKGYLPLSGAFQVLMTTRVRMQRPVSCLELGVLEIGDAIDLLRQLVAEPPPSPQFWGNRANEEDQSPPELGDLGGQFDIAAARELCEWLGRLPLAIELVGRYLAETGTIASVLAELKAKSLAARAIDEVPEEMDYGRNVQAAIELSWQPLDAVARRVLGMVSVFAIAPVELDWVRDCLPEMGDVAEILDRVLVKRSLLTRVDGRYQMHGLVREFVAMRRDGDLGGRFAEVITEIAQTIPQVVTLAVQARVRGTVVQMEEVAAKWTEGLEGIDKCWCCTGLARFYEGLSLWQEAERCYLRSLEISKTQLGERHPDTGTSLNNLAGLYESMGRYEAAEPLYLEALEIRKTQLGDRHPQTAGSLNNLAGLYESMGRYEAAEPLYLEALEIRKTQLGDRHPYTAQSLNNLAGLYESMGRYEAAEKMILEALEISKTQFGNHHINTTPQVLWLATIYRSMGRYEAAEPLYLEALEIRKTQLGDRHPQTAGSLNNLALLYRSMGRYEAAEPLYLEALEIYKTQLGDRHPDTAQSLNNLAVLYANMQQYDRALPLLEQALSIRQEFLPAGHPDTLSTQQSLAILRGWMG